MRVRIAALRTVVVGMAVLVATPLLVSCAASGSALKPVRRPAGSALAQSIAGIRVGSDASTDEEVVRTFGSGLFTTQEGHVGGRYFTDQTGAVTLHTEIGTDGVIEHVELTEGVSVPWYILASRSKCVSAALSRRPPIDEELTLGMSARRLVKKLGRPNGDEWSWGRRILTYAASGDEDARVTAVYEATFTFVNDRLTTISLYDG